MFIKIQGATVSFPYMDEMLQAELSSKGYCTGITVTFPNGRSHVLDFYDPVRLSQDIESELPHQQCVTLPNFTVIIPDVTVESMIDIVQHLIDTKQLNP
jgi:hypothetical protein